MAKKVSKKKASSDLIKKPDTIRTVQIISEKRGLKKLLRKYSSLISNKKLSTNKALEQMGKDYYSLMNKYYQFLKINHPNMSYFKGISTKDSEMYDFLQKYEPNFKRPKIVVALDENARYDIYQYGNSYFAVQIGDHKCRIRILNLWHKHNGTSNIPKKELVAGIVFDKSIDKTDTAFIEKKGKKKVVKVKDLTLNEVLLDYED